MWYGPGVSAHSHSPERAIISLCVFTATNQQKKPLSVDTHHMCITLALPFDYVGKRERILLKIKMCSVKNHAIDTCNCSRLCRVGKGNKHLKVINPDRRHRY